MRVVFDNIKNLYETTVYDTYNKIIIYYIILFSGMLCQLHVQRIILVDIVKVLNIVSSNKIDKETINK